MCDLVFEKAKRQYTYAAVRSAASKTPPLAPKTTPAPVEAPSGLSYSPSLDKELKLTPLCRMSLASSRVVRTASTSPRTAGRTASSFLAVQGITDTTNGSSFKPRVNGPYCWTGDVSVCEQRSSQNAQFPGDDPRIYA